MGATDDRGRIVAELREMIRDPADFYRTRPTVDRVDLANSIVQLLEDDAEELDRLRTFAFGVQGLLGGVVFPGVDPDKLLVESDYRSPLPFGQQRVVIDG